MTNTGHVTPAEQHAWRQRLLRWIDNQNIPGTSGEGVI